MAGGYIGDGPSIGKNYPGKLTFRVFVTCVVAAFGGLIFGYDLGISGGVTSMDPFLKKLFSDVYEKEHNIKTSDNQYCKFDSQTLTMFTSSLYLAALVASLGASTVTRVFGRRLTMLSGGVLFLVGAAFNAFAQQVWMLIVGRMLLGFGIGCANHFLKFEFVVRFF
ncbi:Sugar transport protein 1 [Spatholobus suberectus]|nr:Sugar transport protein 1 [Spatholobus suberectus]